MTYRFVVCVPLCRQLVEPQTILEIYVDRVVDVDSFFGPRGLVLCFISRSAEGRF